MPPGTTPPSGEPAGSAPVSVIAGRYLVERQVGSGGFGVVYFARDRQLAQKRVVIKCIAAARDHQSAAYRGFRKEIEALSRIEHPAVIDILDIGELEDGTPFLVTPFIEGSTLGAEIASGPIDLHRAGRLIAQISAAVYAAHQANVSHRDLKPANIMVQKLSSGDEHIKLIDFGISAVRDPESDETKTLAITGSLEYMAPEQLLGEPDFASDIYALGVIAYEMLTGQKPFPGGAPAKIYAAQSAGVQVSPKLLRASIPADAEKAILKALEFEPSARFASAREFGDVVSASLLAAPPETSTAEPTRGARLEMAQVVFMDIVGYSRLATDEQRRRLRDLQQIVRSTEEFRRLDGGDQLIRIPTGDGMALVFFDTPLTAVSCAVAIARQTRSRSDLPLRIGVNSGPVYRIADINAKDNVAGEGINFAQRIMDCGDEGHLLVTKNVADVLRALSTWSALVHDLGECEVKHGVRLRAFSVHSADFGNPALPKRLAATPVIAPPATAPPAPAAHSRRYLLVGAPAALAGAIAVWYGRNWFFGGPPISSLAILPFANVSGSDEYEYLCDGLTEALINNLGQLGLFKVMSRSAVFPFKQSDTDPQAVGRKLKVDGVLPGRVVVRRGQLTVSAELIKVDTSEHLWGQHYNRRLTETAAVEIDIAREIASTLRLQLHPKSEERLTRPATDSPKAYQLYMRGLFFWNKRTPEAFETAIGLFEETLKEDPRCARAWVGLANCYSMQSGVKPPREVFEKARNAVTKALDYDNELAEAHNALALIQFYYDWNWIDAEKSFQRALELNPSYGSAHSLYAMYLVSLKRFDEALAELYKALELDPNSLSINTGLGRALYYARRYPEAEKQLQATIAMQAGFKEPHFDLGKTYVQTGRVREGIAEMESVSANDAGGLAQLVCAAMMAGDKAAAKTYFQRLEDLGKQRYVSPYSEAIAYIGLGDRDRAFAALQQAVQDRAWALTLLDVEPRFDALREEPRFVEVRKAVGLP